MTLMHRVFLGGLRTPLSVRQAVASWYALPGTSRSHLVGKRSHPFKRSAQLGQLRFSSQHLTRDEELGVGPEPPSFAFAFDIDGVLVHESKPIPGASKVLNFLHDNNIPFILLTNGGGKTEPERVRDLSERLGVPLSTDNFIQSHTPFRELLEGPESLRDKTVLVTGSDYEKCRGIFEHYGFQRIVTPADIYAADPTIFPFQAASSYAAPSRPLPLPLYNPRTSGLPAPVPSTHLKVDAMFVLNDPRDWALDVQIMTDLLLSHQGYLGTYSPRNGDPALPNCGWQEDGQPFLFFSNADLFWSANYPLPRLGQGAFQASLAGLWRRITGGHELRRTCIGKPYGETYRFAERVLTGHRHEVLRRIAERKAGAGAAGQQEHAPGATSPLRTVYMVGDNPESDIAGANSHRSEHGTEWVSVLVRTGVWSETLGKGREQLKGEFRPRAIARDVAKALEWVLQRERSRTKGPVRVEGVEELAR